MEAAEPNQIWQSDMTKVWAGANVGWAYLVDVIDCCTREIVGWRFSHRCRTEDALAASRAGGARTVAPSGSREMRLTMTTRTMGDTVHIDAVHRDAQPARHHPSTDGVSSPRKGNNYVERFHRSLKEEEVWTAEYRSLEKTRASIARWIKEYNHDRPPSGVGNRTPHQAFFGFRSCTKNGKP